MKKKKKDNSETGNRTPGICVTGRDVTNYTISDVANGVSGFRSQYLVLAKHARFRLRQYPIVVDTWGIRTPAGRAHSLSRRAP